MSPTLRARRAPHLLLLAAGALASATGAAPASAQLVQEALAAAPACRALGATRSAVAPCRDAVRHEPADAGLRARLGDALAAAGDEDGALAAFREAIRLAPDSAAGWFGAARLYDRRGNRREALHHYQGYARLTPTDAAGPEITGWLLLEMRRAGEALAAFREATARDATSAGGAYGAGLALAQLGRREEAVAQLEGAVRLAPGNAEAWGALARTTAALGRARDAASYWERARIVDPTYFEGRHDERRQFQRIVRQGGRAPAAPALARAQATIDTSTAVTVVAIPAPVAAPAAPVPSAGVRTVARANPPAPGTVTTPRMRRTGAFAAGSTGSGFIVSGTGHVLTNRHVVRACTAVKVRPEGGMARPATIVALDTDDDLALLRTDTTFRDIAAFRGGREPRPGEDVVAVGYPLNGLLADQVHVTIGSISAMAGLYNDQHELTISTPVQPGNSGGPLLDAFGTVVGVVVTKLNAKVVAEETGDLPQNVNFAIKAGVAREFLTAQGVTPVTGLPAARLSNADVGDVGRKVTVLVECVR